MEKLKAFLITRLLLLLAVVVVMENGVRLLVQNILLPFAALCASYEGDMSLFRVSDVFRMMLDLFRGTWGAGITGLLARSTVLFLLAVSLALFALPVVLGVLWYSGHVSRWIDRVQREREEERAKADEERNLMFSDFAHDLRTPLMTISGYAGALADGMVKDEEKQKEYLDAIRSKSEHMGDLVNQLFAYAKLGSVNFHLQKERLDLNELLRETAGAFFSEMEEADMTLQADIPEEPFYVQADRGQAARVFDNLLANVIRHNPPGTEACVRVRRLAGMEQISIGDTGVRIENASSAIFQPFVKGDSARSRSSGSGLGLSIVKKITEMHGWEISLEQPSGSWTKAFVIRVPERP